MKEKKPLAIRILVALLALAILAGSVAAFVAPGLAETGVAQEFVTLKTGRSGENVRIAQEALQALGYYSGKLDGNFSRVFEQAVKDYQSACGLKETGQIDAALFARLTGEETPPEAPENFVLEDGEYSDKEHVAAYLRAFGHLPGNYITKSEARELGWISSRGNLWQVAPGKSIGGDYFGNYEGLLPEADGRTYTECDIDTLGADSRGAKRIVFSNDGLVYYTGDHYESFELLYGEE